VSRYQKGKNQEG